LRSTSSTSSPDKLAFYAGRGHHLVEGYLLRGAIELICRLGKVQLEMGIAGHVAEIGVHHGRSFILLALLARAGEKAVAIDVFEQQELNVDRSGRGDLAQLRENVARFADESALVVQVGDSTRIGGGDVRRLAGGPIRLFSVDGGHTAEITCHDLETAEEALAPGGVVILDDCFNELWPDVSTGFHRFFARPRRLVPFATGGNKTFLTTPDAVAAYKTALAHCGSERFERGLMDHSVMCFGFERDSLEVRIGRAFAWRLIRNFPGMPALRRLYRAHGPFFEK
jgi:hypothetical protein